MKLLVPLITLLGLLLPLRAEVIEADIVIFGATSGGIAAAVQAKRMGKTAVVLEWTKHLGGLTTGGLGATDIGNKGAIGGLAREFYEQIAAHYEKPDAWKWESQTTPNRGDLSHEKGNDPLVEKTGKPTKWTFEPHVADGIYRKWLADAGVRAYLGEKLASVKKDGRSIVEITSESGRTFRGKVFIDASYEGDLMAKAGVSFHVGREANATYGEEINGVRASTPKHQFLVDVDPFVKPGVPSSGLLPFIQPGDGGKPGEGDASVQAYNFRLCMTQSPQNRVPWSAIKPADYDASRYELLARLIEKHESEGKPLSVKVLMNPVKMPNTKTDTNNNGPFSTDFIGANYAYPNADYATRERIWKQHEDYIKGFLYFLSSSPRVAEHLRNEINLWGLAADEFQSTGNFPPQMYVREARRMISDYVMTEADCRWSRKAEDPVGMGAYNMDSHNCQRLVQAGVVRNEGDVQVRVSGPYGVSYRSIVPKQSECENLLVPVCLAASHIAYGSIRMEPVFMVMGQSAATAAALALDSKTPVQKVQYAALRERLTKDGQVLEWTGPARQVKAGNFDPKKLPGVVLDDDQAEFTGDWTHSSAGRSLGIEYRHDGNTNKGAMRAVFKLKAPKAGEYELYLLYPPNANRATNLPVTIVSEGKEISVKVNQRTAGERQESRLGRVTLPAKGIVTVTLSNEATDGYVVADGVQMISVR